MKCKSGKNRGKRNAGFFLGILSLVTVVLCLSASCNADRRKAQKYEYGVFLNADRTAVPKLKNYEIVVIDAQYFSKKDIRKLHAGGTKVYSYLNIGSIENFRSYYKTYEHLAIGDYENWEEEKWVDVASPDWQQFIGELVQKLDEKGVDGFFIDNCDVYYYAPKKDIFEGLTMILKNIRSLGKAVIINGGDTYVTAYQERYGSAEDIMTGVNQETVWSSIDFDTGTFHAQAEEERDYFCNYLKACKADGMEVYLLEYTTDWKMIRKIKRYCKKEGFHFYIADSLELEQ